MDLESEAAELLKASPDPVNFATPLWRTAGSWDLVGKAIELYKVSTMGYEVTLNPKP